MKPFKPLRHALRLFLPFMAVSGMAQAPRVSPPVPVRVPSSPALTQPAGDDLPTATLPQLGAGPALIITVDAYHPGSAFPALPGIQNDGAAVKDTLLKLGFLPENITVLNNPTAQELREAMDTFGEKAAHSRKVSFLYFTGHGVLYDGKNYLVPAKTPIKVTEHLPTYAVPIEHVLAYLGHEKSGPALVFVDACRNNTLPSLEKSASRPVALPQRSGLFIGYATGQDRVSNATLNGSLYTTSLCRRLLTAGRSVDDVYAGVISDVLEATKTELVPQNPQKQSALRVVLHLVPGTGAPIRYVPDDVAAKATRESPLVNSLGQEYIPVPGKPGILMCRMETRVADFEQFARETGFRQSGVIATIDKNGRWADDGSASWEKPGFPQTGKHPVVAISWNDAKWFLQWLSAKEGRNYRLPSLDEWDAAAGDDAYPWGNTWPPPKGAGNLFGREAVVAMPGAGPVAYGHSDGFVHTAPVGSFPENKNGFHDLAGNVWEWCEDSYRKEMNSEAQRLKYPEMNTDRQGDGTPLRVTRGGSWFVNYPEQLGSRARFRDYPSNRVVVIGFRCVLDLNPR